MRAEGIEPSASALKVPRSTAELRPQGRMLPLSYAITHLRLSQLIEQASHAHHDYRSHCSVFCGIAQVGKERFSAPPTNF